MRKVLALVLILFLASVACSKKEAKKEEPEKVAAVLDKTNMADTIGKIPDFVGQKNPLVVIETDFGNMEMEVLLKEAPKTAQNFLKLVSTGFYDSLTFHRIVPDFVIQAGDPLGNGTGGPGYYINDEIGMKHKLGSVGMATSGPNTAGSQFYICLRDLPQLDKSYSVFGKITDGMDVAGKIAQAKTDGNERPLEKIYIKKVYITVNEKDRKGKLQINSTNIEISDNSNNNETQEQPKKEISYEILERWAISNCGEGKAILIARDYLNEADMTALGEKLKNDTKNDKCVFISVFTDKKAAALRNKVLGNGLSKADQAFYCKHSVGQYTKNGYTGFDEFAISFDGLLGTNHKTIKY